MLRSLVPLATLLTGCASHARPAAPDPTLFTLEHVARTRSVRSAVIAPDGARIAYVLSEPRKPWTDADGPPWSTLQVVSPDGARRPFVTGDVAVHGVAFLPDGSGLTFLARRGEDEEDTLWAIPIDGGEARRMVEHETAVGDYSVHPDGDRVAWVASEKEDPLREAQREKGFDARVYEEEPQHGRVWIGALEAVPSSWDRPAEAEEHVPLAIDGHASRVRWDPTGTRLLVTLADSPRVDDALIRQRLVVVDPTDGSVQATMDHEGKLRAAVWAPDGQHIAFIAGQDLADPSAGRLKIGDLAGTVTTLLADYEGQVEDVGWFDDDTVWVLASEGTERVVDRLDIDGGGTERVVEAGVAVFHSLEASADGTRLALVAGTPAHPAEVFRLDPGSAPRRLTDHNPWLADLRLAPQETIRWPARDGLGIEGVLIRPLDAPADARTPLLLVVHGGPESHISNGWVTAYSRPGQVAAARGIAVLYPNYRGSTGRGVAFSQRDQRDYAGAEFDDLVDAVTHLDAEGRIDREKVGITGGSYGGYATAWAATRLTEHFAVGVMHVGVSDLVSKFGTTDIPWEMYHSHARVWPWEDWGFYHDRSPIRWAEQARTPLLILHGERDTRVHPSQSLELYRYLHTLGQVPVRLVFYPEEGHGNANAASRLDYGHRAMRWLEHYLLGPGGDPPPPLLDLQPPEEGADDGKKARNRRRDRP